MSAFIVNKQTIDVIVKGFEVYNVRYDAENYKPLAGFIIDAQEMRNRIGQSLLDQNYESVNYRYRENVRPPKYEYEDLPFREFNEGLLCGCIDCFEYQACETENYFTSQMHFSLQEVKNKMLERYIENAGQDIPWGYSSPSLDDLEL